MKESDNKTVSKPWGHEELWVETRDYVGKLLCIRPNCRLSLQYHRVKEETILVQKGTLLLHCPKEGSDPLDVTGLEVRKLTPGSVYHVFPNTLHRFEAGDSSVELIEVSTPHLEDVVRVEDDFGRTI